MSTTDIPDFRTPLTTYLDSSDAERLRALTKSTDRSIAGEIRFAIRKHLNTSESPAGRPSSRDDLGVEVADHVVLAE
jgi:hypothetical protein